MEFQNKSRLPFSAPDFPFGASHNRRPIDSDFTFPLMLFLGVYLVCIYVGVGTVTQSSSKWGGGSARCSCIKEHLTISLREALTM